MNKIEFEFDGDKVVIEPSLLTCTLTVGSYFEGNFTYTPSRFRIDPPGKLSKRLINEIERVMEKWNEKCNNISLETHIKARDRVKRIYADTRLPESKG
jgi:hypothetical protein